MKRFALCLFIAGCARGAAPSSAPQYAMSTSPMAGAPMAEQREPTPERPGLGTTYGEEVYSPVHTTPFMRSDDAPWAIVLHYNDDEGTDAHAQYLNATPAPLIVPVGEGAVSVALVDEAGRTLPGFDANGRALVIGHDGERYKIRVHNATTARFEVVASVDGLDVIDGQPADPSRRGYIVDPHDDLVIDGFRTSDADVAAFRFGRVAESYAARTSGDRNVGVVGLAVFSERGARWRPVYSPSEIETRDTADPFPARGYSQPPQ